MKAEVERGTGDLGRFREAMEYAAGLAAPPSSRSNASVSAEALRV